jgi:serine/threonine protein kinase
MTADPVSPLADSDSAERVFVEWLSQRADGAGTGFAELCALHPDISERLARLHQAHARAQEVLGQMLHAAPAAEAEAPIGLPTARYQLRAQIAAGGMGQIYEVYDPSLRRTIAMKVLRAALPDAPAETPEYARRRSRLLAEAQILAQLDHPGVVSIHEMGLDDSGRAYFTMKRVRGQEFGAVIAAYHEGQPSWSLPRAVGALLKVCEAVAYAHTKGVIHRDLKPSNVMVGRFGEVFVMDWGLAKVIGRTPASAPNAPRTGTILVADDRAPHASGDGNGAPEMSLVHTDRASDSSSSSGESTPLLTLHGDVVGTPAYMPPEQARGEVDSIDARADVYGVGALLYHLLAGKPPYASDAPLPGAAIVTRVLTTAPAPLPRIAPRAPEELVAACDKAMARDREQRYPTMLDLADDLRAWLEGRVVRAHKTGTLVELRKWIVRNKGAAAAIAAVIVGLGATATVQSVLKRDVERAQVETAARAEALRQQDYKSRIALAATAWRDGPSGRVRKLLDGCPQDLRGWEWRFLSPRVDTSDLLVRTPADRSRQVLFTPDGCSILTLGAGELSLLDAETGALVRTIDRLPPGIPSFSADGALLAVMCNGRRLALWRTGSWQRLPDLATWTSGAWPTVACCPADARAAVFGPRPTQIWDLERRALLAVLDTRQVRPYAA